jgi:hypothetical protein
VTLAVQQICSTRAVPSAAPRRSARTRSSFAVLAADRHAGVYSVLLMIPIGALVILFLRNFVGVKTFGTFMPVLVAPGVPRDAVLWGIVLFVVILSRSAC